MTDDDPPPIRLDADGENTLVAMHRVLQAYLAHGHDGSDALDLLALVADKLIRDAAPDDAQEMIRQGLLGRIAFRLGFVRVRREADA